MSDLVSKNLNMLFGGTVHALKDVSFTLKMKEKDHVSGLRMNVLLSKIILIKKKKGGRKE